MLFRNSKTLSLTESRATITPARAPPATSPVAKRLPEPSSLSSVLSPFFLATLSDTPLIAPPTKIGNVVESGDIAVGGGISLYNSGPTLITENKIIENVVNGQRTSGGGIDVWTPNSELYITNNIVY